MTAPEPRALEIASFRYRIIADVAEAEGGAVRGAIAAAAARSYVHPAGHRVRFSSRTLWRWLARYHQGGLPALTPRRRKDAGTLRAVSQAVLDRAVELRGENTDRPTKTVIDILQRLKVVGVGTLTRSTLDRPSTILGPHANASIVWASRPSRRSSPPPRSNW